MARYDAALLSSMGRPPRVTHGRRPVGVGVGVDVDARRPGSRVTAELPVAVGRLRLPRWSALVSALDQEVPRAPGGGTANAQAAARHFATGSS